MKHAISISRAQPWDFAVISLLSNAPSPRLSVHVGATNIFAPSVRARGTTEELQDFENREGFERKDNQSWPIATFIFPGPIFLAEFGTEPR